MEAANVMTIDKGSAGKSLSMTTNKTKNDEPRMVVIELNTNDVLLGRGVPSFTFSGNVQLRQLAKERKGIYASSRKRELKAKMAQEIIDIITTERNGRFLREISDPIEMRSLGIPQGTKAWIAADYPIILRKVKQAMREPDSRAKSVHSWKTVLDEMKQSNETFSSERFWSVKSSAEIYQHGSNMVQAKTEEMEASLHGKIMSAQSLPFNNQAQNMFLVDWLNRIQGAQNPGANTKGESNYCKIAAEFEKRKKEGLGIAEERNGQNGTLESHLLLQTASQLTELLVARNVSNGFVAQASIIEQMESLAQQVSRQRSTDQLLQQFGITSSSESAQHYQQTLHVWNDLRDQGADTSYPIIKLHQRGTGYIDMCNQLLRQIRTNNHIPNPTVFKQVVDLPEQSLSKFVKGMTEPSCDHQYDILRSLLEKLLANNFVAPSTLWNSTK